MTSQEALYGALLTSKQQYHREIQQLSMLDDELTPEEEERLVDRARQGDNRARCAMIESCLEYIEYWAGRLYRAVSWQSWRIEYEELVGIGNAVLVDRFDYALPKESPLAYLKACAKKEMQWHCYYHKSIIPTPAGGEYLGKDIFVESLDVPLSGDEEDGTFADVLVAFSSQELPPFEGLYQAIERLPEKKRTLLRKLYGLDSEQESFGPDKYAYDCVRRAVADLRKWLTYERGKISFCEDACLEKFHCMRCSQEVIRLHHSMKYCESCKRALDSERNSKYYQQKKGEGRYSRLTAGQRLDQAYHWLQEQQEKITVARLAKTAHVNPKQTMLYLRERRSQQEEMKVFA